MLEHTANPFLLYAAVTVACIFRRSSACGYENIAFQAIKAAVTVHILHQQYLLL
jgi:hypothetical protein